SNRLQHAVGGADRTWCGFAVWASDTAGQSIRGQELPEIVVKVTDDDDAHRADVEQVNRRIRPLRGVKASRPLTDGPLQDAVHEALHDVSRRSAHGNTIVYAELAPLLVAFVERCEAGHVPSMTTQEVADLLAAAAGRPLDEDLAAAFEWWRRAVVTTDERARA